MNRKLLIAVVVLGLVLVAGVAGGFWMTNRAKPSNVEALKTEQVEIEVTPTPVPAVRLEIFEGEVTVNNVAAIDGMVVNEGDQVATGMNGRAQLVYPSGTQTRLDNNAKITLKKFVANPQQISVFLEVGRIWNRVTKLFGGETYQTESSTVVATVRGTSYGMGILPDGTNRITATSGKVENKCNNESQAQDVTKNLKTEMNCKKGQKPKTIEIKESDIKNDNWLNFNSEEDKKQEQKFGPEKFDDKGDVLGLTTENQPQQPVPNNPEPQISCTGPDGVTFRTTRADCDNLLEFWKKNTPSNPNPYGFDHGKNGSGGGQSPTATPTPTPAPVGKSVAVSGVAPGNSGVYVTLTGENFDSSMRFRLIAASNIPEDGSNGVYSEEANEDYQIEYKPNGNALLDGNEITMRFKSLPCRMYKVEAYHKNDQSNILFTMTDKELCTAQIFKLNDVQWLDEQCKEAPCLSLRVYTTNFDQQDNVMIAKTPYPYSPDTLVEFTRPAKQSFDKQGSYFDVHFYGATRPMCGSEYEIKVVRDVTPKVAEAYAYWVSRVSDDLRKDCPEVVPTPVPTIGSVQVTGEGSYTFSNQIIYYLSLRVDGLQGSGAKVHLESSQGSIYTTDGSFDGSLYASFSTADSNLPPCGDTYKMRVDVDGIMHEWGGQISDQDRPNTCSIR